MPKLKLDSTPTGVEEYRDFDDREKVQGANPYNEDQAKSRIDRISRWLAIIWSIILTYMARFSEDAKELYNYFSSIYPDITSMVHIDE